jgi:hypothetical protein
VTVSLFGYLWAGLHDINITAGSIIADEHGAIFSNPASGNGRSGNINLVSQREINLGISTIFTESRGKSGSITLTAGTTITTGFLTATGAVRGGDVTLSAKGDILTSTIRSFSDVNGGAISVVSTEGSINTTNDSVYGSGGYIHSVGGSRAGGSVTINAYGDILTRDIRAESNSGRFVGGIVKLTSQTGGIDTNGQAISTFGRTVTLTSVKDIKVGNILASAITDQGVIFNGGAVTLTATDGNIEAGQITSGSNTGNAKNVIISAKGLTTDGVTTVRNIKVGDISANSSTSVGVLGSGGNVGLYASGDVESGNITTSSNAGNAGYIKIAAGSLTELDKNIKVGNLDAGGDVAKTGDVVLLRASGSIESGNITTTAIAGNAGNVRVESVGDIVTNGLQANSGNGNGGNIKLISKAGKIDTKGEHISTYSNNSNAGNVNLNASLGITVGEINAYASVKAGEVILQANQDISTQSIYAGSFSGNGNKISITSVNGGIDANSGLFSTTSVAGGNAGAITLIAAKDIKVGDIYARSKDEGTVPDMIWTGGKVTLEAGGNIESGNVTTTSITGSAGIVTLEADLGIKVGNVDTFTVNAGDAGNVRLTTLGFDSDITALAIKTNAFGNGEGGGVRITSGGYILVDSIRADSIGGIGGDIRLVASKTVRVTSSFSVNSEDYSIYTDSVDYASGAKGASVTIQHSSKIKNIPSPFIVGDSSVNGTVSAVSDGVIGLITKQGGVHEIDNNFNLNEIHIKGNNFLASQSALLSALGFSTAFLSYAFKDNKAKLDNARNLYLLGNVGGFTLKQLRNIATDDTTYGVTIPSLDVNNAQVLLKAGLNFYLYLYGITTPRTQGHFIAQSLHETGGFKSFGEINSGVSGFDVGRGILQLTGKANYRDFGTYIGIAGLEKIPQVVSSDTGLTILSAMWYWSVQYATSSQGSLNSIAEMNAPTVATVDLITSKINYGEINIDPSLSPEYKIALQQNTQKRREYFLNAKRVLGIT